MRKTLLATAALVLGFAVMAPAATRSFSYQGQLTDSSDNAISGNQNMAFELFNAEVGGTSVESWVETAVPVTRGLFNVELDLPTLTAAEANGELWMEVTVGGTTMTPRKRVHASFFALNAEALQGRQLGTSAGSIPYVLTTTGKLAPSILSAPFPLEVSGVAGGSLAAGIFYNYDNAGGQKGLQATGASIGLQGEALLNNGTGVHGQASSADNSAGTGVLGTATNGVGVRAQANAAGTTALQAINDPGVGLYARGNFGLQVAGVNTGILIGGTGQGGQLQSNPQTGLHVTSTEAGIIIVNSGNSPGLQSHSTGQGVGIEGKVESANGIGIRGLHIGSGFGTGVWGLSDSVGGTGLRGEHGAISGNGAGVRGSTGSPSGLGVEGTSPGTGVRGVSAGTVGSVNFFGVHGSAAAPSGVGVKGESSGNGNAYGLYGKAAAGTGAGAYGEGPLLGVHGKAELGNNASVGVKGEATATGVMGVATQNSGSFSVGVQGDSASASGVGVKGSAAGGSGAGMGVWGASAADQGVGVYGQGRAAGLRGQALTGLGRGVDGDGGAAGSGEGRSGVYGSVGLNPGELGYGIYGKVSDGNGYAVYADANGGGLRALRAYNPAAQGADSGYALGVHGKFKVGMDNARYEEKTASPDTDTWVFSCPLCGTGDVVLVTPASDISNSGTLVNALWVPKAQIVNGSFTVRTAQPLSALAIHYFVIDKD